MAGEFKIKFDGLQADQHELPLTQFGNSLVGLDRIVNAGLVVFAHGRAPKRKERFDLRIVANEPVAGSFELFVKLAEMPWLLPIVQDFIITGGIDATFRFSGLVFAKLGGRPGDAEMYLNALLQLNRDHLEARGQSDDAWRSTLLAVVERLAPAARQAVTPLGDSATELVLESQEKRLITKVDEPMADAIRSKDESEVGDMAEMEIKIDGIIHHNRQLKVFDPSQDGRFVTAEVRDPLFDTIPNPYADAAASMGTLRVQAKPLYRNGQLHKLYIMDLIDG